MKRGLAILLGGATLALGMLVPRSAGTSGPPSGAKLSPDAIRLALVARAREDLNGRVVELPGMKNQGPIVNQYLAAVHEAPGADWCAAGLSAWLRDVFARANVAAPMKFYSGAKLMGQELRRVGWLWIPAAQLTRENAPPGSVLVWDRSIPDDPSTVDVNENEESRLRGHIGIVELWKSDDDISTIEANSGAHGDRVAQMARTRKDPRLLGAAVPR